MIHELKARRKELEEQLAAANETAKSALEEARTAVNGKAPGLTGEILKRYERADATIHDVETELRAIESQLGEERAGYMIVGGSAPKQVRANVPMARDQKFADLYNDRSDRTGELAEYLRDVAFRNTQSVGVNADGGHTVPEMLSASLWDLARDRTVARDAGVSFVPLTGPGSSWVLPKVTEDASPAWVSENTAFPEDGIEFGAVDLSPQKLGLIVKSSRELLQDSALNVADTIVSTVSQVFAREIDKVIFNGNGTTEPLGIRNFPGIPQVATVGTPNWGTLSDASLAIRQANYEPSAFVMAPRDAHTLANQREDGATGAYLAPPSTVSAPRLSTNMVDTDVLGDGSNESYILGGDFSQAVVGARLELDVQPLMERYADFGQVGWVFTYRMDTTVVRPEAFQSLEGVTV